MYWLLIIPPVLVIIFFGWAFMAAAKRGDEMDDELAQFTHDWKQS